MEHVGIVINGPPTRCSHAHGAGANPPRISQQRQGRVNHMLQIITLTLIVWLALRKKKR